MIRCVFLMLVMATGVVAQTTQQDAQSALDAIVQERAVIDASMTNIGLQAEVLQSFVAEHEDHVDGTYPPNPPDPPDPPAGGVPSPGPFAGQSSCVETAYNGGVIHSWCEYLETAWFNPTTEPLDLGFGIRVPTNTVHPTQPAQLRLALHSGGQYHYGKVPHPNNRNDVVTVTPDGDPPGLRDWFCQTSRNGVFSYAAGHRMQAALDEALTRYGDRIDLNRGIEISKAGGPTTSLGSTGAWCAITGQLPGYSHLIAAIHTQTGYTWTPALAVALGGTASDWAPFDILTAKPPPQVIYKALVAGLDDTTTPHDPRVCQWLKDTRSPHVCVQYAGGHGTPADLKPQYQIVRLDWPVVAWLDNSGDTPCMDSAGAGIPCHQGLGFHVGPPMDDGATLVLPVMYTQRVAMSGSVPDMLPVVTVIATIYRIAGAQPGDVLTWSYMGLSGHAGVDADGALNVPLTMTSSLNYSSLTITR